MFFNTPFITKNKKSYFILNNPRHQRSIVF